MTRVLYLAAISLALAGASARQAPSPCQFDRVCQFLDENIGLTTPPATLARLRSFARVEDEKITRVKNLHDPGTIDEVHDLRYDGLTVKAYAPAAGPVLIQAIVLTSPRHHLPLGLAVNSSTVDAVQKAIGLPKTVTHLADGTSTWTYENVEGTASFVFTFAPEPSTTIRSVRWIFDAD